jgi:UrcA family protein
MTSTDFKFAVLAMVMALAVTGATLAATTPVFSADFVVNGNPAPTARVGYADLDLHSAAGAAQLGRRVAAAASKLCIGVGTEALADRRAGVQCRDAAVAAAEQQIRRAIGRAGTAQESPDRAIALTLAR